MHDLKPRSPLQQLKLKYKSEHFSLYPHLFLFGSACLDSLKLLFSFFQISPEQVIPHWFDSPIFCFGWWMVLSGMRANVHTQLEKGCSHWFVYKFPVTEFSLDSQNLFSDSIPSLTTSWRIIWSWVRVFCPICGFILVPFSIVVIDWQEDLIQN